MRFVETWWVFPVFPTINHKQAAICSTTKPWMSPKFYQSSDEWDPLDEVEMTEECKVNMPGSLKEKDQAVAQKGLGKANKASW